MHYRLEYMYADEVVLSTLSRHASTCSAAGGFSRAGNAGQKRADASRDDFDGLSFRKRLAPLPPCAPAAAALPLSMEA